MKRRVVIVSGAGVLVLAVLAYFLFGRSTNPKYDFRLDKVSKGSIAVVVSATGTVNPVISVDVGTQVSGIVSRLYADYNSIVKEGEVIAQSMLHRPRVLFLDEPTVGLDPMARHAVWERIGQLRADYGTTILLTTHYMDEAEHLCDRGAFMHQGKITAVGSPAELKASIGGNGATLDDVFEHYTGGTIDEGERYSDIARTRRTARRLG